MSELELVKLHEDGEHLVLSGPGGQSFLLPITEALRAAVRRDRAQMEHWRASDPTWLSPRAIQGRLRSGETPEEVATNSDVPLEHVRRFAGPVLAEQEYVVNRLRAVPADSGSTELLGERVDERLALRDVSEAERTWRAFREPGELWTVEVSFPIGDETCRATWSFDQVGREHHALDDEARWLGQEADDAEVWRDATSAYRATRPVLAAVDASTESTSEPEDPDHPTHSLLDDLALRRGVRQDDDVDDPPEAADTPSARVLSLARNHAGPGHTSASPTASNDDTAERSDSGSGAEVDTTRAESDRDTTTPGDSPTDGQPVTGSSGDDERDADASPEQAPESPRAPESGGTPRRAESTGSSKDRGGRRRKGRATVPSWDDIVFGAKHD